MRFEAPADPCGLTVFFDTSWWAVERAIDKASEISLVVSPQSITEDARKRPRWRSPIFTVGVPKEGASINPLEEFPTTAQQCFPCCRCHVCLKLWVQNWTSKKRNGFQETKV